MFNGLACFSPGVSQEVRSTWSKYSEMYKKVQLKVDEELQGGQIAISFEELDSVEWFFATVEDTDWVGSLRQLRIVVYDQRWILHSAHAGYRVFLDSYVLPDVSRLSSILVKSSSPVKFNSRRLPWKQRSQSELEIELTLIQDEDSILSNATTLVDGPSSKLASLTKNLNPTDPSCALPVITLDAVFQTTPAVSDCAHFQPGGSLNGATFHAKRQPLVSILKK